MCALLESQLVQRIEFASLSRRTLQGLTGIVIPEEEAAVDTFLYTLLLADIPQFLESLLDPKRFHRTQKVPPSPKPEPESYESGVSRSLHGYIPDSVTRTLRTSSAPYKNLLHATTNYNKITNNAQSHLKILCYNGQKNIIHSILTGIEQNFNRLDFCFINSKRLLSRGESKWFVFNSFQQQYVRGVYCKRLVTRRTNRRILRQFQLVTP